MTRTIHAVAIESDSSGAVDWYTNEAEARRAFGSAVASIALAADDINRFAFDVPDSAHPDEITTEADDRMWNLEYTPIERRAATEGDDIFLPRPELPRAHRSGCRHRQGSRAARRDPSPCNPAHPLTQGLTMNKMHFCCMNVPGGWQTAVWFAAPGVYLGDDPSSVAYPLGPVFPNTPQLWAWQADNLPKLNQG